MDLLGPTCMKHLLLQAQHMVWYSFYHIKDQRLEQGVAKINRSVQKQHLMHYGGGLHTCTHPYTPWTHTHTHSGHTPTHTVDTPTYRHTCNQMCLCSPFFKQRARTESHTHSGHKHTHTVDTHPLTLDTQQVLEIKVFM